MIFFQRNFQDLILAPSRADKNTQKWNWGHLKKSHFFHRTPLWSSWHRGAIQPKLSLCIESMLFKEVFIPAAFSFHSCRVISIKTLSTLDVWSHCDKRSIQSHLSKEVLESWHENCKLIWKLQRHMKIAKAYENCKLLRRNYTLKCENRKLIWILQTDMKIANWYENCKANYLTF